MAEPCIVTGQVTNDFGTPEAYATVRIETMNVGTTSAPDGTYRLVIPPSRIGPPAPVSIIAKRVGLSAQSTTITVSSGGQITQNFVLRPAFD